MRNNGDGTFTDVTEKAGILDPLMIEVQERGHVAVAAVRVHVQVVLLLAAGDDRPGRMAKATHPPAELAAQIVLEGDDPRLRLDEDPERLQPDRLDPGETRP